MARVGFEGELKNKVHEALPPADRAGFDQLKKFVLSTHTAVAWYAPRGIGADAWDSDAKKQRHIRRRFPLLGQTLDGMRVWDVRAAIGHVKVMKAGFGAERDVRLTIAAQDSMAGVALYASLFEPGVTELKLLDLPRSHREGPDLLNVLKFMDLPAAVAMAAERSKVTLYQSQPEGWDYPAEAAKKLAWPADRFKLAPAKDWPGP